MATKHLALLAALLGTATPGQAFDTRDEPQTVMFYYAIPFDAHSRKERSPWMGMQIQGKRDYQAYSLDFDGRLFKQTYAEGGASMANLLIVGGVVVGAAALVGSRGKSAQQQVQQEQAKTTAANNNNSNNNSGNGSGGNGNGNNNGGCVC
jgi:hypothetical protein